MANKTAVIHLTKEQDRVAIYNHFGQHVATAVYENLSWTTTVPINKPCTDINPCGSCFICLESYENYSRKTMEEENG